MILMKDATHSIAYLEETWSPGTLQASPLQLLFPFPVKNAQIKLAGIVENACH